jgi:hypothetical protein
MRNIIIVVLHLFLLLIPSYPYSVHSVRWIANQERKKEGMKNANHHCVVLLVDA